MLIFISLLQLLTLFFTFWFGTSLVIQWQRDMDIEGLLVISFSIAISIFIYLTFIL